MRTTATLLALLALASVAEAEPRTLFHGGTVFTGDPAHPFAEAIAIEGDRVVAVGTDAAILAAARPHDLRIDLQHRALVPGFNDAHVHVVVPEGQYLNAPDFIPGAGTSLADVVSLVAHAGPGSGWVYAFVGSNIFDDDQATRFALDAVAGAHPVALFAWTGHGIWLSSKAMQILKISTTEPDPFGGHYRRFPGTQVLTGEVHEYAEFMVRRRLLALLPDGHIAAQYQAFAVAAVKLGYTSLQDMGVGLTHRRALDAIHAADLPLRVRSICFPLSLAEPCELGDDRGHDGGDDDGDDDDDDDADLVRASGVKWITDGTPVERLAFVGTPYLDRPGTVGAPDLPALALRIEMSLHRHGSARRHQLLFHSVGDAAIDEVLDAMEATGGHRVWSDRRTRIEHGDLLFPSDYARARDLGIVIVQNPTHFTLAPVFAERYVPAVVAELEPLRTLLGEDIPLAIGTDGIGAPQSPFLNLFLAMVHPTRPSEALSLAQAVTAFTQGAAYAELEDDWKGRLTPGSAADLAVLSKNIFAVAPPDIIDTTSDLTMVAGRVVWDSGKLHQP